MAKLAAGRYEPAATTWVKIKNRRIGKRRAGPISLRSPAIEQKRVYPRRDPRRSPVPIP